jgi:hypothetical protein
MTTAFQELIRNLNLFIKRYYYNQLIKGALYFISGFIGLAVVISLLEYFGFFSSQIRAVLFFGFIAFNVFVFIKYLIIPLLHLFKIGKSVTLDDAAVLLGRFFKNVVDDKITNTLQLRKYLEQDNHKSELLIASIEQKSALLARYPFKNAVNFSENKKYLYPALVIILLFLSGWYLAPMAFRDPVNRIVQFDRHFERPAPFDIYLLNELPLSGFKNERFTLKLEPRGNVLPSEIFISYGKIRHKMNSTERNLFEHEFRNLDKTTKFFIEANGFNFGPYTLNIISKAVIKGFSLSVDYPGYTGRRKDTFQNVGDLEIPEGSIVSWSIFTEDTDKVQFQDRKSALDTIIGYTKSNSFEFRKKVLNELEYSIVAMDQEAARGDSLSYFIKIIKDMSPVISINEYRDSILVSRIFMQGMIRDDYGFSRLSFHYKIISDRSSDEKFISVPIPFDPKVLNQNFYYAINLNEYSLQPGDGMELFFQVTDNDAVNGPKSTRSEIFIYNIPTYEEIIAESIQNDEQVKSGLSHNLRNLNELQNEIDKLRREMLRTDNVTWEQRESLKNLLEKQNQAMKEFENTQRSLEEQMVKEQQFQEKNSDILKKQQELEKLFDEVLSDEMKDLFKKIQEELEKLNKEEIFQMLDKMQFEMSDFENRLDRALELFKQLQVERMMQETIEALDRLKEDQALLNQNMNEEGIDKQTNENQEELNRNFDFIDKMIEDMKDRNSELSRPNKLEDTSGLQDEIKNKMDTALEQMKRNNMRNSNNMQQDAAKAMDKLSEALKQMQQQMQKQNLAEDIRTLREILDNLIKSSFNQEDLMKDVGNINVRDPRYVDLIQTQRKIKDDLRIIQDSLNALAKRQVQIQSIVNRELSDIQMNIDQSLDHLINRRKQTGMGRQQFVMTHINNLALLLNESMQNMQNMMDQMGAQDMQMGEGNPGMQDLRQMQEEMNKMLDQLQKGHQPKPGESGEGGMSMSERLARMAAQQEAIRNSLNDMSKERRKRGEETKGLDEIMKEMEGIEMDIVTNNISRRTQIRQQQILTRMLEHEKAEKEQEKEEQRVGNTAKVYDLSNPEQFFEYNRMKNREVEMLRSLPPAFRPHYKSLTELYFLNVD